MHAQTHRPSIRAVGHPFVLGLVAGLVLVAATSAHALVVDPFFSGHSTIDGTTQEIDWRGDAGFEVVPGVTRLDIDVQHGAVDDGGISSRLDPGNWDLDMDVWGPLINRIDITLGGVVTYGNPVPGVFAVSWVDVVNRDDHSIRNTFQVVFVGTSGFHTNTGLAIDPGSVIFAYGSPSDPHGTVHLSDLTPAGAGIHTHTTTTLFALGVGDTMGVLSTADVAALQNSGDPFLFDNGASGLSAPIPFESVAELPHTSGVEDGPAPRVMLAVSPNPVHRSTTITYTLAHAGPVRLAVFDVTGREVATLVDGERAAGAHELNWDAAARALPTGIYLARLTAEGVTRARAIVLLP